MSDKLKLNVIGDPIMHSKSPIVHGMVFDALGLECDYGRVLVKKGELGEYVKRAIGEGVCGFNLTMPHKVDIIPYLKEIDRDAELFGAVNTVKIKNGELWGYNTDAQGFVLSLEQNGIGIEGKNITVLGAGGVVSTLALKMSDLGAAAIAILNRTPSKAAAICEKIRTYQKDGRARQGTKLAWGPVSDVAKYLPGCDLLINATPLGMSGMDFDYDDLSFMENLNPFGAVCDLIYSPPKTKFLSRAETLGHKIINGLGMLIGQAILADEIYLGKQLDICELYTKTVQKYYEI